MKLFIAITAFITLLIAFCQKNQNTTDKETIKQTDSLQSHVIEMINGDSSEQTEEVIRQEPKTIGKISHRFRKNGCTSVIIVAENNQSLILVPRTKLDKEIDVDGLEIIFNYHLLKMKNPPGCEQGIPAEISDVRKK